MKTTRKVAKKAIKKAPLVQTDVQLVDNGLNVKLVVNGRVKRVFRDMEDYNKDK